MKRLIVLGTIFFFLFGCASATTINSIPSGAKLYLDQEYKGETPYTHTDRSILLTKRSVTLKTGGYQNFNAEIKRSELDVGALIGTIFLTIPVLWILKYPSQYIFEMEELKKQ